MFRPMHKCRGGKLHFAVGTSVDVKENEVLQASICLALGTGEASFRGADSRSFLLC